MGAAKPSAELAAKVLPKALHQGIVHVFSRCGDGVALVGGTAIAGYYAGHRRSDDMDLFTKSEEAQKAAVLAIRSLAGLGAKLRAESQSPLYYHAVCELHGHTFTADAVLDENLFRVGKFHSVKSGAGAVVVADLETLLAMKMAALVSRCSEKDIFDMKWLLTNLGNPGIAPLLSLGAQIDGGLTAENLLGTFGGATLREEACGFSLDKKVTAKKIFAEIRKERDGWIRELQKFLAGSPPPAVAALMKEMRKKKGARRT